MAPLPHIPICILAGGQSRRFGEDKALAELAGKPLLEHVLERVRGQTSGPIAINAPSPGSFERWGLPIIRDLLSDSIGPLAGILTAMEWASANGAEQVVTLAVDLPFVPLDFVEKLNAQGAPTIAVSEDRWHPVNGLWRVDQYGALRAQIDSRWHSAHSWAKRCKAALVTFDTEAPHVDPFWNINTREDLAKAEEILSGHQAGTAS
ncbi:molybdenum cofactor guanylyltransferase [Erythrobacter sp. SCSIO 43205]|uniref:molybdenum cofactor guanylyltransferase n=1 Tax=Erythrobacter sp. SCSIO 43205 TaxID=2779361 RepID=UPI001CA9840E|nr:molybdenum cofactor guanylyltransferase [Erythrobacter sp. SCSIO 43205]UAB79371.1 molybdenum cofactor guanylyltransferase [Erythrobacter sp. SCSIO 43205]